MLLSIDFAGKTGWVYGYKDDNNFVPIKHGKFRTKGKTEKEKIFSLITKTRELFSELGNDIDTVIFEDSIAGGMTSLKTLRATFGKRYSLIGEISTHFPNAEIYCLRPTIWHNELPDEFKYSKTETSKYGKRVRAKGKEKKKLVIEFINSIFAINLKWENERIDCDNDIADAYAIAYTFCKGTEKGIEKVG